MPLLVIQSLCHNAMLSTKSFGSFTPDDKGLRIDNDEPTTRHRLTDVYPRVVATWVSVLSKYTATHNVTFTLQTQSYSRIET